MNIYSLTDNTIRQKIGERLKSLRLRQNMTQSALAKESQVSISSIKNIEKGDLGSFDSFIRVLRTLGYLEIFHSMIEDEEMSPNEYYEFVHSSKRKIRKRAHNTKSDNNGTNEESGW